MSLSVGVQATTVAAAFAQFDVYLARCPLLHFVVKLSLLPVEQDPYSIRLPDGRWNSSSLEECFLFRKEKDNKSWPCCLFPL